MCGICGVYHPSGQQIDLRLISGMINILKHRGPDDYGLHVNRCSALGIARLAIIDLSAAVHQPMPNEDNTVWIVCDGETYNHRSLQKDLEVKGHRYRSNSVAETVLHLYEEYGEACVKYLRGMYAFAIWDSERRELFLAVDRLGIKPLYYAQLDDAFVFASEIKAILLYPTIRREVDLTSLDEYLRYTYVPAPRTIFKGIHRLPPAHSLTVKEGPVTGRRYWELRFKPNHTRSEQEWVEKTRDLLGRCVQDELESDVPLGAFLSGGIDSSSIVAFMSQASNRPVQTFTIGFTNEKQDYDHYDETRYGRLVAQRFSTDHREMVVAPDVLEVLPKIVWHFDEPFANITAVPTWYLCEMARQHVTVTLAGAGGDELFGGYPRYLAARFLSAYFALPKTLREGFLKRFALALPQRPDSYFFLNRVGKFILGAQENPLETYRIWMSAASDKARLSLYSPAVHQELARQSEPTSVDVLLAKTRDGNLLNRIFYADLKTYLPDNLLTYSDRMASAHSLEMRVPFCDHRLVEFAATIPPGLKLKGFSLKYLLKKALVGLLPHQVLYRPKRGFSVPLGYWLQNELLPLAKSMLSSQKIEQRGYFNAPAIQTMLDEHMSGKTDHSVQLWALIIFELWHTLYLDKGIVSEPDFSLHEWGVT